ncbi:sialate O-acetylesterase [Qipengyuania flava]|uniref:sialate O-acetylesterase n=1 Tax=Qipengyuania flava TaxID=192812 RepID=UPI001C624F0D|nr:sialate O-acetylesterase [Qipengyuania flava]QYJ06830.1 sialate O-acetylesterase [Qipengyuania flava]
MRLAGLFAAFGLLAGCTNAPPDGWNYTVYYLGGQSNMDGFGLVSELPEGLEEKVAQVPIFHGSPASDGEDGGGQGIWQPLKGGHGSGYDLEGQENRYSDKFGPEIAFAARLIEANPDQKIAIVKYSLGGTALVHGASGYGSWDPAFSEGNRRNQYDNALTTIDGALQRQDIDGDGAPDTLVPGGIVWMQGESDAAHTEETATSYRANLARIMGYLRAALRTDGLPVVIGKIKDSGDTPGTRVMAYSPLVQEQQAEFVAADPCAALVTVTEQFNEMPDKWHYVTADYLTLGEAFADAMLSLRKRC